MIEFIQIQTLVDNWDQKFVESEEDGLEERTIPRDERGNVY